MCLREFDHGTAISMGCFPVRAGRPSVLAKPNSWERYGLKPWIKAAKERMHYNVLAIVLANQLARIAWAVLDTSDSAC